MADEFTISVISITVTAVIFGSLIVYNIFNRMYWESGVFPPMLLNRRVNHYEATVNIAMNILLCDPNNFKEKQRYLSNFLRSKFPEIAGGMQDSVKAAISLPLTTQSVAYWMNKHMPDARRKQELLSFFFSLASIDDTVGKRELQILSVFSKEMKLSPDLLSGMLEKQRRLKAERLQKEQEKTANRPSPNYRSEQAAAILGLQVACTLEEVKKAYRKLAMIHHPDKFQNEPESAQIRAKDKFLKIQEAYEYFEAKLN